MADPAFEIIRAIEERSFNAWPALETHLVEGWLVRLAAGYTKRANSLNAWAPRVPIEAVLPRAESLLRARSLPVIVRISPIAGGTADDVLAERRFARIDETRVMIADIAPPPLTAPPHDHALHLDDRPSNDWSAGFAAANQVPRDRRAIHDRMLAHIQPPVAFATLHGATAPLAYGLAAVERGWVGLFDIVTLAEARRQGAARRLVGGLLAWAADQGARQAYLQVAETNAAAFALYEKLGFSEAYRYHYRVAP